MHDAIVIVIFAALLGLLAIASRFDLPRRADQVVRTVITIAAILVAFELGIWQGTALLVGTVVVAEVLRIKRKRVKVGA